MLLLRIRGRNSQDYHRCQALQERRSDSDRGIWWKRYELQSFVVSLFVMRCREMFLIIVCDVIVRCLIEGFVIFEKLLVLFLLFCSVQCRTGWRLGAPLDFMLCTIVALCMPAIASAYMQYIELNSDQWILQSQTNKVKVVKLY